MKIQGVMVPLVTPFKDGKVDYQSYSRMINNLIEEGINGVIPLATTGESPTISEYEYEQILQTTIEITDKRVPIYTGFGGNNTGDVVHKLKRLDKYDIDGILSVAPYYSRPNQQGLYEHFKAISESTDMNIIIYNIPYRTGTNIENDTMLKLSALDNIVGVKDCCGDMKQTTDLLINRPENFSIMTGEDAYFYTTLTLGGDGGIMASASVKPKEFIDVYNLVKNNHHQQAFDKWKDVYNMIPLLFAEPNPSPVKYCLKKLGIIDSDEVRLPLVNISRELANKLDGFLINK